MTRRIILLGAGGHARVLVAALRSQGKSVGGCVAPEPPGTEWPADIPYLGDDAALDGLDRAGIWLVNGVGSTASADVRRRLFETTKGWGFRFATVVHPAAAVVAPVRLGEGAQIMAGAVVQTGVELGDNVIVNTAAVVDHDCRLGNHCHVAPGATLSGGVSVGEDAHVGTGATVIQGIRIGRGAIVAAGAVVVRDVPEKLCVAGVPARPLRAC